MPSRASVLGAAGTGQTTQKGVSLKARVLINGESSKVTFPATGNGHNNSTEQTYKPTLPSYRT